MKSSIGMRLAAVALAALTATSLSAADEPAATYCVIDLSAGADAASYPDTCRAGTGISISK